MSDGIEAETRDSSSPLLALGPSLAHTHPRYVRAVGDGETTHFCRRQLRVDLNLRASITARVISGRPTDDKGTCVCVCPSLWQPQSVFNCQVPSTIGGRQVTGSFPRSRHFLGTARYLARSPLTREHSRIARRKENSSLAEGTGGKE